MTRLKRNLENSLFAFSLKLFTIHENPESTQKIITEVLNLKQSEQNDLANLLEKSPLSSIINASKRIANRLDSLKGLHNLVFDKDTKKHLLERDQLHKILEEEPWIFDENFALSASEEKLEEVLRSHIGVLRPKKDGTTTVEVGDGQSGRIDLMLNRAISLREGERDYLVVELKRPSKKIDENVITQVKRYAQAVSEDERFHGIKARWKFVAVSNEMNKYAKSDSSQPNRPQGLIWESEDSMVSVWVPGLTRQN